MLAVQFNGGALLELDLLDYDVLLSSSGLCALGTLGNHSEPVDVHVLA